MTNPRIPFQLSSDRPRLSPPQGRNLIVHVVINVENWRFDQPMPRKLLTAPHGHEVTPDIPNFSWAEYGMRNGMPRLLDLFSSRNIPVSCSLNAAVIENYPQLAKAICEAGWEFIGHGLHQKSSQAEDSEAQIISQAIELIARFSGKPVAGWLSPGLKETLDTPDILKSHGIKYCCDWVLDDLPTWMTTQHGPMIAMPYSLEINDSVVHAVNYCPSDEMLERLKKTIETYERETSENPRMITLGLHPHLIAVPHRFPALVAMIDFLSARDDTIFMTGSQIADWFEAECPAPA